MIGCPLENHPGHKNRDTPKHEHLLDRKRNVLSPEEFQLPPAVGLECLPRLAKAATVKRALKLKEL